MRTTTTATTETNWLIGKSKEPEVLSSKTNSRAWSQRNTAIAGSMDMRFGKLLPWAEVQKNPITSTDLDLLDEVPEADNLAQRV